MKVHKCMKTTNKPTIYHRFTVAIISGLIGAFIVPILVLLFSGGLNFDEIAQFAKIGAVSFAVLGFAFPKLMGHVLFVLTLFQ